MKDVLTGHQTNHNAVLCVAGPVDQGDVTARCPEVVLRAPRYDRYAKESRRPRVSLEIDSTQRLWETASFGMAALKEKENRSVECRKVNARHRGGYLLVALPCLLYTSPSPRD